MADDGAMDSLLAAVAVAAASNASSPHPSSSDAGLPNSSAPRIPITQPPQLGIPATSLPPCNPRPLAPINPFSRSKLTPAFLPPPPPPLPPPLPSPPPLPPTPVEQRNVTVTVNHPSSPSPGLTEKRKGARVFTADEKRILEANYSRNKFPSRVNMETLGKVLGKGTEKVRTWYNNRRALDRKLGIHVMRNHDAAVDTTPHPTPDHTNETAEETVVLPMRFITSPSSLNSAHPITPSKSLSDSPIQALRGANDASLITVTPSAIAWAPSTSPVTRATPNNVVPTPPALDAPNRFRISPLRIRNVRLKIGNTEISGELPEDLRADTGLEVKFLFGKKRIVYEWYCGTNYADAQSTGGPYAKVEMNFSSVNTMQLQKGGAKSILLLSFSTAPTLFLQTPESMDKYKVRSQQRQYQKVMPSHFPILVSSGSHSICMRTDDAVRVSKILIEDTPSLGSVFDVTYRQSFPPSASPQIRSRAGVSVKQEWASGSEPIHKDAEQSLGVARRRPLTVLELSSKQNIEAGGQEVETRSQAMTLSPFTNVIKRSPEPACIQNEFCPSTSANPFATPSSHKSPTTPLTLSARRLRGENPLWLTTSASGNATPTPFPGRLERRDALRENQVRRELNFNVLTKTHPDSQTPTETGHKRKAHIAFGDENVRNAEDHGGTHVDLRMLSPLPNSDTAALRGSNVRPPSKRHLASSAIRKDGTDSRRGNVVGGASSAGVGRNLPR